MVAIMLGLVRVEDRDCPLVKGPGLAHILLDHRFPRVPIPKPVISALLRERGNVIRPRLARSAARSAIRSSAPEPEARLELIARLMTEPRRYGGTPSLPDIAKLDMAREYARSVREDDGTRAGHRRPSDHELAVARDPNPFVKGVIREALAVIAGGMARSEDEWVHMSPHAYDGLLGDGASGKWERTMAITVKVANAIRGMPDVVRDAPFDGFRAVSEVLAQSGLEVSASDPDGGANGAWASEG